MMEGGNALIRPFTQTQRILIIGLPKRGASLDAEGEIMLTICNAKLC